MHNSDIAAIDVDQIEERPKLGTYTLTEREHRVLVTLNQNLFVAKAAAFDAQAAFERAQVAAKKAMDTADSVQTQMQHTVTCIAEAQGIGGRSTLSPDMKQLVVKE